MWKNTNKNLSGRGHPSHQVLFLKQRFNSCDQLPQENAFPCYSDGQVSLLSSFLPSLSDIPFLLCLFQRPWPLSSTNPSWPENPIKENCQRYSSSSNGWRGHSRFVTQDDVDYDEARHHQWNWPTNERWESREVKKREKRLQGNTSWVCSSDFIDKTK